MNRKVTLSFLLTFRIHFHNNKANQEVCYGLAVIMAAFHLLTFIAWVYYLLSKREIFTLEGFVQWLGREKRLHVLSLSFSLSLKHVNNDNNNNIFKINNI